MIQTTIHTRSIPQEAYQNLIDAGMDELFARLFSARGCATLQETQYDMRQLLHFSQLANIQAAARTIADAIKKQEKIIIVADYDADGATACAVAIRFLRDMGAMVDFLVPSRFTDGYGITPILVDKAYQQNASLLITVDNGINAHAAVKRAKELNIKIVITDHHLPGDTLPDCVIVNPNQHECSFPCKSTAGVGVILYVLIAVRSLLLQEDYFTANRPAPNWAKYLDLVAIGTVADVVRLEHNNRILVQQGLKRIREGKMQVGVKALFAVAKCSFQAATTQDFGFKIAPRINAAGRLETMDIGIKCLITDDFDEAMQYAEELNRLNQERQTIQKNMIEQVNQTLPDLTLSHHQRTICAYREDWHEGVIGIVAGKLRERFFRPAIVFAPNENGEIRGSGRSIDGLHLRDALDAIAKRYPHIMSRFGGHAMAAGLTLNHAEQITDFQAAFEEIVQEMLPQEKWIHQFNTDGSLSKDLITIQTANLLAQHVWGQGFAAPSFYDEFTLENQTLVGKEKNHSKLTLNKDGQSLDALLFGYTEQFPPRVRAIYQLYVNHFKNQEYLQIKIEHWEAIE